MCAAVVLARGAPPETHAADRVAVRGVTIDRPVNGRSAAVRLAIDNRTGYDDRLLAVSTDAASTATIHVSDHDAEGRTRMRSEASVEIPAGRTTYFAPGLLHVMLTGLRHRLDVGDEVRLALRFQRAGRITVTARVVPVPTN